MFRRKRAERRHVRRRRDLEESSARAVPEAQHEDALVDWLIRNASAKPEAVRAAVFDQYERSTNQVARVGTDWPERDEYGNPMLKVPVAVWLPGTSWQSGVLEARLSAGMMSSDPNLNVRVIDESDRAIVGSSSIFLLPRPDIAEAGTFEIRWTDAREHYATRAALLRSDSAELDILVRFLEGYWARSAGSPVVMEFRDPTPQVHYTP